jgi:hypothetical protein
VLQSFEARVDPSELLIHPAKAFADPLVEVVEALVGPGFPHRLHSGTVTFRLQRDKTCLCHFEPFAQPTSV